MIWFLLFTFLVIAGGVAVVLARRTMDGQRPERLADAAHVLEMSFRADAGELMAGWFKRLPLFQAGVNRVIRHVIQGAYADSTAYVFDFEFVGDTGKATEQTVVAFDLNPVTVPTFSLWPAKALFESSLMPEDAAEIVSLPEQPEFADVYRLYGSQADATRRVFSRPIVLHLEQSADWSIEGCGRWLVMYRLGKLEAPGRISQMLAEAYQTLRVMDVAKLAAVQAMAQESGKARTTSPAAPAIAAAN